MKTHGVLFKGEMMLALLREVDPKTQTRRLKGLEEVNVNPHLWNIVWQGIEKTTGKWAVQFDMPRVTECIRAPWSPGDEIYAKETWCVGEAFDDVKPRDLWKGDDNGKLAVDYRANEKRIWHPHDQGRWRPSIFMPRWASRYRARITQVRCQRLQEITEADAKAEGVTVMGMTRSGVEYRAAYAALWDSINGPGSWNQNPWVFAYTFGRIK